MPDPQASEAYHTAKIKQATEDVNQHPHNDGYRKRLMRALKAYIIFQKKMGTYNV